MLDSLGAGPTHEAVQKAWTLDLPTLHPQDIKGADLKRSITQMKMSASGLDGRKVAELALLTTGQLDMLAAFFKQCDNFKLWTATRANAIGVSHTSSW